MRGRRYRRMDIVSSGWAHRGEAGSSHLLFKSGRPLIRCRMGITAEQPRSKAAALWPAEPARGISSLSGQHPSSEEKDDATHRLIG